MENASGPQEDKDPSSCSERELIERVLHGEKELYEQLMRRNNQTLFRVLRGYLRDEGQVEDAMQNAYIKAFEKLGEFRKEASFSTWLIRIGINEAMMELRKTKRRQEAQLPSEEGTEEFQQLRGPEQESPERMLNDKELKETLETAIDKLEAKYRSVFIMKELEGMSIQEIGAQLELSASNVKVRIHRAKEMLKEDLLQDARKEELFPFKGKDCDRMVRKVMGRVLAT